MHHYLWPSSPFSREVSGILGGMVKDADATEYSFCRILGEDSTIEFGMLRDLAGKGTVGNNKERNKTIIGTDILFRVQKKIGASVDC
ncbi:hypothetical protein WN944_025989 [Citrus x changshan-huyou]|uniref:Uncharacterized protein n=1 Tax=Citrus x changshan-huyou TaxID=2935761 RepID=A0AAP0QCU6_9ROSI